MISGDRMFRLAIAGVENRTVSCFLGLQQSFFFSLSAVIPENFGAFSTRKSRLLLLFNKIIIGRN